MATFSISGVRRSSGDWGRRRDEGGADAAGVDGLDDADASRTPLRGRRFLFLFALFSPCRLWPSSAGGGGGGMMAGAAGRPPLSLVVVVVALGTRMGEIARSRRPCATGGRLAGPGGNLAADGVSITVEDKEVDAAGGPPRPTLRFLLSTCTRRSS